MAPVRLSRPAVTRRTLLLAVLLLVSLGSVALHRWSKSNASPVASPVDFNGVERQVFSQDGEDGVIEKVFQVIEPTSRYCVEFGGGDGVKFSNMRNLILNHGFRSLMIDGDQKLVDSCRQTYATRPDIRCAHHWVYPGNVETLFEQYGVPKDLDFLVIDIDSFDYYVWKVMHIYRPKLLMIEINGRFAPPTRAVVEYSPFLYWDNSFYYGASLQSMYESGRQKGYELIYVERRGLNAFFVDRQYFERFGIADNSPAKLYRPHNYSYSIPPEQLDKYIDPEGFIRPGNPAGYFSDKPIQWNAMTVRKRWVIGR